MLDNQPESSDGGGTGIAIIGMAGRFPGARSVDELWANLCAGVESISTFTRSEVIAAGVPSRIVDLGDYVRAGAVLDDVEWFDAELFGYSPREAAWMDPQQRLLLECAVEALENAGRFGDGPGGSVGVFASVSTNGYLYNLTSQPGFVEARDLFTAVIGTDKDYVASRIAYKLDLEGPAVAVQTACSSSLVAMHLACQALLAGDCDMALAGGVSVRNPQQTGYLYVPEGILSPDGHCRAFDAEARGTVEGNGVGVVVLKRLEDALEDGDHIRAVVRGSAINNDGAHKVGYTAPRVEGQARAIRLAHLLAEVDPETITYIEAHGTGTQLGDPIEIAAITQAFREATDAVGFCGLGSIKSNLGHLNSAAGVTGLIKTVLALEHGQLPPSLHFSEPNPRLEIETSPVRVIDRLEDWRAGSTPRRAGVSSFGVGGTNAHVVLEEAPQGAAARPGVQETGSVRPEVLVLSARTPTALDTASRELAACLGSSPQLDLSDVVHTLQHGRKSREHRRAVVCRSTSSAAAALSGTDPGRLIDGLCPEDAALLTFMFPGQGAQYVRMAEGCYRALPVLAHQLDRCAELLAPELGLDIRELLFPAESKAGSKASSEASERLGQTAITQPVILAVEYALARQWMAWGLRPGALIGHSIGEYAAACLAGVMSLEDALSLVALRGRLIQEVPPGDMLSVELPGAELEQLIASTSGAGFGLGEQVCEAEQLSIAAENAPSLCVVSGRSEPIEALRRHLETAEIGCRVLKTSHALHSAMMEPVLGPFREAVTRIELRPPEIPFVSTLTGTWVQPEDLVDPEYWVRHIRHGVRFSAGLSALLEQADHPVLLEVGPGRTLCSLAGRHRTAAGGRPIAMPSLPHPQHAEPGSDLDLMYSSLARMWTCGVAVSWQDVSGDADGGGSRHRVPLPGTAFERQYFWVERIRGAEAAQGAASSGGFGTGGPGTGGPGTGDAWHSPGWSERPRQAAADPAGLPERVRDAGPWLVLGPEGSGLAAALHDQLEQLGATARLGTRLEQDAPIPRAVLVVAGKGTPTGSSPGGPLAEVVDLARTLAGAARGVDDARANGEPEGGPSESTGDQETAEPVRLGVVTSAAVDVSGIEGVAAERAVLAALPGVLHSECPEVLPLVVDIPDRSVAAVPGKAGGLGCLLLSRVLAEVVEATLPGVVALRGERAWVPAMTPAAAVGGTIDPAAVAGCWVVCNGLEGPALALVEQLVAADESVAVILVEESELPEPEQREAWIAGHGETDPVSARLQALARLEAVRPDLLVLEADLGDAETAEETFGWLATTFAEAAGAEAAGTGTGASAIAGLVYQTAQAADRLLATIGEVDPDLLAEVLDREARVLQALDGAAAALAPRRRVVLSGMQHLLDRRGTLLPAALHAIHAAHAAAGGWTVLGWESWQPLLAAGGAERSGAQDGSGTGDETTAVLSRLLGLGPGCHLVRPAARAAEARAGQHERPQLATSFAEPRNEFERVIAEIWQELLGIEQIGVHDNFFDLGGDSLLATQITSRLRQVLSVDVPLRRLLEGQTIAELAAIVLSELTEDLDESEMAELLTEVEG